METLSVICVTYRDPDGLQQTLASLEPVTRLNLLKEIVVVDSSPELSAGIIAELGRTLPITHISSPPEGIYAAMNLGLRKAQGDFFWFLNGGDRLLEPSALESGLRHLRSAPDTDLVSLDTSLFRDGKFRYPHPAPRDWWEGVSGTRSFCHQAVLYRAESFREIFPFDTQFRLAADFDLHLRAFLAGKKYHRLPGNLVAYDTSGASANSRRVTDEIDTVLEKRLVSAPSRLRFLLRLGHWKERVRLATLRGLSSLPGAKNLQPLWLGWKRWAARMNNDSSQDNR